MITFPASITGAAQTGFTTPAYTTTADQAPDMNAKQVAITAIGGTQTGVTAHSVSAPFLLSFWKPKVAAVLGKLNLLTGIYQSVPKNVYKLVTLKGVTPGVNQPTAKLIIRTEIEVPAGCDTYDAPNVRAALSAHIGMLSTASAGVGDTAINGVM